jgi:aminoglycoside phosphotransferase (APT) family kinase protein
MEFRPIEREPGAFQQSVTADEIELVTRAAFGPAVHPSSAVELGLGLYNNTYRVDIGRDRPVVLRVAPDPARQTRDERELMRNEHATVPYLGPIAAMLPTTLAVDFTHTVIPRDWMFQTYLSGLPGPDALVRYPPSGLAPLYRQLGSITKRVHSVRGDRFGSVLGPWFSSWSDAVLASMRDIVADLEDAGVEAGDVREAVAIAELHRAVLDEITEPRLLTGDLWIVNVLIDPDAAEPTITGVCDCDRSSWGDPESDFPLIIAGRAPGTERDAFWDTYSPLSTTPTAVVRAQIYRARTLAASRLERHRLGKVQDRTWGEMQAALVDLRAAVDARARLG